MWAALAESYFCTAMGSLRAPSLLKILFRIPAVGRDADGQVRLGLHIPRHEVHEPVEVVVATDGGFVTVTLRWIRFSRRRASVIRRRDGGDLGGVAVIPLEFEVLRRTDALGDLVQGRVVLESCWFSSAKTVMFFAMNFARRKKPRDRSCPSSTMRSARLFRGRRLVHELFGGRGPVDFERVARHRRRPLAVVGLPEIPEPLVVGGDEHGDVDLIGRLLRVLLEHVGYINTAGRRSSMAKTCAR